MPSIPKFIARAAVAGVLALLLSGAAAAGECEQKLARAVSVQGPVETRAETETNWHPVKRDDSFCPGDKVRVLARGRALIALADETMLRLDQNSTLTLRAPDASATTLVDLLRGVAYFFSRTPRTLTVTTPFVNATIEGTEFLIASDDDRSIVTVYEGRVAAANAEGRVTVTPGRRATARKGEAPVIEAVARPRDAVQWALHYPPVVPAIPADLESAPPGDWRARASFLLSVGRVDDARTGIDEALKTSPGNADALALLATIAVVRNEKAEALSLAAKAVASEPRSSAALIALSYARQASFDLAGARAAIVDAVKADPGNGLAWARLAEVHLALGEVDKAVAAAREAVSRSPGLSRTQAVLGFAHLAEVEVRQARDAFGNAAGLDPADPLPRLGAGLALIRAGRLAEGRRELEIAAGLDPGISLVRSYLGKAYYEEKRDTLAAGQFAFAEALDPKDPTPYYYDAIRKQGVNRPVEALRDLRTSIALNDNRAVYRSRLLLDQDLAARGAGIARIYDDLGFQQLAVVEGHKSADADPASFSAHLFLSDAYAAMPRREIARVSELLQGQLLQPIAINPVPPRLADSRSLIMRGTGPGAPSFNEFSSLFNRDRLALLATGIAGNDRALGDEIVQSGVAGKFSCSVGQFHFRTDGFRPNDDMTRNIVDGYVQYAFGYKTSVQAEVRRSLAKFGDPVVRFSPDDVLPDERQREDMRSYRFGLRHAFAPGSDFLGSFIYLDKRASLSAFTPGPVRSAAVYRERGYNAEIQQILRAERWNVVAGAGHAKTDFHETENLSVVVDPGPPPISLSFGNVVDAKKRHSNAYVYSRIRYPDSLVATLGGSVDSFKDELVDRTRINPKAGAAWTPFAGTTLRAAAFRVLKRTLVTDQTLEPTQVAGFNQFFDDTNATESWTYGAALDQELSADAHAGLEYFRRNLDVPIQVIDASMNPAVERVALKEGVARGYLYWTPGPRWSASGEYLFERLHRGEEFLLDGIDHVSTQRFPVGVNFTHPAGVSVRTRITYVAQRGAFVRGALPPPAEPGSDYFWLFDASVGYRLPSRLGLVTVEGKNIFDRSFRFQDTDRNNPSIQPGRTVLVRLTVSL